MITTKITCDFCGSEIFKPRLPVRIDDHTAIDIDVAFVWPDLNCNDKHVKDVCVTCLKKMLEKYLKEQK